MKKIIFILCAAATVALAGGCTKFLDTVPDNRTEIDNLTKVKALLVSAYPTNTYVMLLDPRCDGYMDFGSSFRGTQPGSFFDCSYSAFRWDEYPTDFGWDNHESYWIACYSAIAAANHALEGLDRLGNKQEHAPYKAEALLCRAYSHFMLLSLFSNMFDEGNQGINPGLPYVTKSEDVVIEKYDRETVTKTLEKIKADIDAGLANAPSSAEHTQPKFHFTRASALAFAARFALYTRDYQSVINYVSEIIPQVTEHTKLSGTNSDGSAIEVPKTTDIAAVYARNNLYDWAFANTAYTTPDGWGYAFSSPNNNNNLLMTQAMTMSYRVNLGTIYARYALSGPASASILGDNVSGTKWIYAARTYTGDTSSWIAKYFEDFHYSNITAGIGTVYAKIALFRMEEMLLARAEAFAMTGQYSKALDDLNIYLQMRIQDFSAAKHALSKDKVSKYYSATVTSNNSYLNNTFNAGRFSAAATSAEGKLQRALVMTCLDFRYSEYVFEGMRWFDILRWYIPVTHTLLGGQSSTLEPDDDRRVLQIPATASLSGVSSNRMTNISQPW